MQLAVDVIIGQTRNRHLQTSCQSHNQIAKKLEWLVANLATSHVCPDAKSRPPESGLRETSVHNAKFRRSIFGNYHIVRTEVCLRNSQSR